MRRVRARSLGKDRGYVGVPLCSLHAMMKVDRRDARAHARAFVALMATALLAAACGSSSSSMSSAPPGSEASTSGSSPSSRGVVIGTVRGPEGAYLTGADGQALYLWAGDSNRKSNCSGECTTEWPPLITKTTGIPSGGITAAGLGTIIRSDGSKQVTYMGHPCTTSQLIRVWAHRRGRASTASARGGGSSLPPARRSRAPFPRLVVTSRGDSNTGVGRSPALVQL